MNRTDRKIFVSCLIISMILAACGRASRMTKPVPTVDSSARETSIAATSRAQFGTPTPVPSPTDTSTPSPSISIYGTSLSKQADGSSLFTDHRAGVQITFPPNWLALRVGESEYYQAWEKGGSHNPVLLDALTLIQNRDSNQYRLTAYDMAPDHFFYTSLSSVNIIYLPGDERTLHGIEYDVRTSKSILKKYKYLPTTFQKTASGLDTAIIQYQWEASSSTNQIFTGYSRSVVFKVPTGTFSVNLSVPFDQKSLFDSDLNQIVDSIVFFTP